MSNRPRYVDRILHAGHELDTDAQVADHTLLPPPEYTSEPPTTHLSPPQSSRAENLPPLDSMSQGPSLASLLRRDAETPGDPQHETLPSCSGFSPNHPAYHVVSGPDLQNLLSLAAAQLLLRQEQRKRQRDESLHHSSRQARGPRRHTKRTRVGALAHFVRHTYGVQQAGAHRDAQSANVDPESLELLPQGGADDGGWQDE